MATKAICLISGGLDSSLTLMKLLYQGYEVTPIFVDYNQWPAVPEEAAVNAVIHYINSAFPVDRRSNLQPVVKIVVDWGEEVASVWGRGIALVGLASMWAYTHGNNYTYIALGNHKGDVGPDCKPGDFDRKLNEALKEATKGSLEILLPIADYTIEDIGNELSEIGIPWDYLYSCYWYPPCGYKSLNEDYRCPGCRRKRLAMEISGFEDKGLLDRPNSTRVSYQSPRAERLSY